MLDSYSTAVSQKTVKVVGYIVDMNPLENETNLISWEVVSRLFDEEKATDNCEGAANILESVVVKMPDAA